MRDDVPAAEPAVYRLHALDAAGGMGSTAAARRPVTRAGRPPPAWRRTAGQRRADPLSAAPRSALGQILRSCLPQPVVDAVGDDGA